MRHLKLILVLAACAVLAYVPAAAQGQLSVQVLQLLSRVNTWTATQSFQDLRVPIAALPSDTAARIYTDISGNLYYNGGLIAGAGGGVTPHNLLSSTHSDTLTGSIARGDVIVGNSTPKWARLAVGTAGKFLRTDGTDVTWSTDGSALTSLPAANLTGTIAAISGVNLTNLNASNLASGTVPLAQLSGILNAQIGAGAAIAYSKLALTASVVNADIASGAAIAYSKLNLTGSVVTGDLVAGTLLFDRWSLNGCTANQIAKVNAGATAWACAADANSGGTVTSVALTAPAFLSIAGSPVSTTGTLAVTLATQTANTVFAGPTGGGAVAPTFRALVNADFPTSGVVANTFTKVTVNAQGIVTTGATANLGTDITGTLAMANGGTGVTVATDDTVLMGTGAAWAATAMPNCTGGALAYTTATNLFSCQTGGPTHNLLSATHSDVNAAAVVRGDLIIGNSTPKWNRLAIGAAGTVLTSSAGTDPAWSSTVAYGTITSSTPHAITQTWNAAVTFTALQVNVTDTSSNAGSLLADLQIGGVSKFNVTKAGLVSVGSNLAPITAGSPTLGTTALPFGSAILGTAATNNLSITPAVFAQGTVATADDPALAAVKLPLVRRGTIAYTAGALSAGTCSAAVTATITGLTTTAVVTASLNGAPGAQWQKGIYFLAYPTANTVNIVVCNPTAGSITPDSSTLNYAVFVP